MYVSDIKHTSTSLANKLESLYRLNRGAKLDLGFRPQYLRLLEKFGNPHLNLPPTIHVAGTNGKGSTLAFLRAMLEAEGKHVHTYTSPHLIEFNERIVLAGQKINNAELENLIDEALHYHDGSDISFFEITTAIAFKAFASHPANILLLETGLGGRLDCTNVIQNPIATIITPISLDHQEFLGNTLNKIAAEKAGIMKANAPCIIAPQANEAISALKNHANTHKIQTFNAGSHWFIEQDSDPNSADFRFQFGNNSYRYPAPALRGSHQIQNAATAIAALHIIADHILVSYKAICTGLKSVQWPARLQDITAKADLPKGWELWLDGGHNESAAQALSVAAQNWCDKPLHIIIGMMDHKEKTSFLQIMQRTQAALHLTYIPNEQNSALPHWRDIIITLTAQNKAPARILICGSLYLAGDVLQTLGVQA